MKKITAVCILSILFAINGFTQGYNIEIKINGLQNKQVFLAHHYADKFLVDDTIQVDENGRGTFSGGTPLDGGMYLIYLPNKKYFDFLVGENQNFKIINGTNNFLENGKYEGSKQNTAFLEYQNFLNEQRQKLKQTNKQKKKAQKAGNSEKIKKLDNKIAKINNQVNEKRDALIKQYKGKFLSTFLKATKDVEIPEPPEDTKDSLFRYRYYKNHYLDNIDFTEDKLLRTSIFSKKLMRYIKNVAPQNPDSLINRVDKIIERAKPNHEVYKFVMSKLYNYFNESKIMGMDKVFVHIADYYLQGKTDWNDSTFIADLRKRVASKRPNLIGKKAKDFKVETLNNRYIQLSEVDADYTVLYFYDPDCGHCEEATPKMKKISDTYIDKGVEFIGFFTQTDKKAWKEYVEKYDLYRWKNVWDPENRSNFRYYYDLRSTPRIYILDENKEIVARRLGAKQTRKMLKQFIDNSNGEKQ